MKTHEEVNREVQRNENNGREKFKALLNSKEGYEYLETDYFDEERLSNNDKRVNKDMRPYDCIVRHNGKISLVELKDRDVKYDKWYYKTLYLEEQKYQHIHQWKKKLNADGCYYVNFIGNKCYIFNLDDDYINSNLLKIDTVNKCTAASKANKIPKLIYDLPKDKATLIEI